MENWQEQVQQDLNVLKQRQTKMEGDVNDLKINDKIQDKEISTLQATITSRARIISGSRPSIRFSPAAIRPRTIFFVALMRAILLHHHFPYRLIVWQQYVLHQFPVMSQIKHPPRVYVY